jgi:hypothetical protein
MIARPDVGSTISVTVTNPFADRMIPPQPQTTLYRGQVVKSDRWLTDQEFAMTGDARYPVRVINLKLVCDIDYHSGQGSAVDASAKNWEVTGSRGDRYVVTRDRRGYTCDCKGFQFRRSCRHVAEISQQN